MYLSTGTVCAPLWSSPHVAEKKAHPCLGTKVKHQGVRTHSEGGHSAALQEAGEHVGPVVLVVGHAGETHVDGGGEQEELHGGPQQPRPLGLQPGLDVQLATAENHFIALRYADIDAVN